MNTRIRRLDLHEKVWAKPMTKVAVEYGLSDVGLKKICKKYKIPVPGRGYWARFFSYAVPDIAQKLAGYCLYSTVRRKVNQIGWRRERVRTQLL